MEEKSTIVFYTDGYITKIIWKKGNRWLMVETSDDRNVEKILRSEIEEERKIIEEELNYLKYNVNWKELDSSNLYDRDIFKQAIAALNWKVSNSDSENESLKSDLRTLIEESRYIWERYEDEVIPDPIPTPNMERREK